MTPTSQRLALALLVAAAGCSQAGGPARYPVALAATRAGGRTALAVLNDGNDVLALLGADGTGALAPTGAALATGSGPTALALADLDGDGVADAVSVSAGAGVSVARGQADGTFGARRDYALGGEMAQPCCVVVTDVDGDGTPDVVVAGATTIAVLLGKGDGTLASASVYPVATAVQLAALASADLNGDGKADLVLADASANTLLVLLGQGNGTFTAGVALATDLGPSSVAVADLNGDGRADLVVTEAGVNAAVRVLLGKGDGSFAGAVETFLASPGAGPRAATLADLDGDGRLDLVVADESLGLVSVLKGGGDGSFGPEHVYAAGNLPVAIAVADLNGDGHPDLAVADNGAGTVTVLLGDGSGAFTARGAYASAP